MNRQQLFHAIRSACSIASIKSVIIVGSQSILGTFDDAELPAIATISREIDVIPDVDNPLDVERLSDLIEGIGGELSAFEDLHGFALDGVDLDTAVLPAGWRERLVPVSNDSTEDVTTGERYTGWCLDPADLCVSKLCAGREKDRAFVWALLDAGLVDPDLVKRRLEEVPDRHKAAAERTSGEFFGGTSA